MARDRATRSRSRRPHARRSSRKGGPQVELSAAHEEHHPPTTAHLKRARPTSHRRDLRITMCPCAPPSTCRLGHQCGGLSLRRATSGKRRPRARAITIRTHPLRCVRRKLWGRTQPSLHVCISSNSSSNKQPRAQQQQQLRQAPRRPAAKVWFASRYLHQGWELGNWCGMASVRTP